MSYKHPSARIIIFAKAPIAGHCKTRLIPALGAEGAANLHQQLLYHSLYMTTQAQLCPVELWCADEPNHPFYQDCQQRFAVQLKQQQGNDLGQRMAHALRQTLEKNSAAIIIGSDCPSLQKADMEAALQTLNNPQYSCVLSPAYDGGYVLVGLKQACDSMFQGIHWGSKTVLAETRQQLLNNHINWHELKSHYDIDLPTDLQHLPTNIQAEKITPR